MRRDLRIVLVAGAAALGVGLFAAREAPGRTTRPGAGPDSAKPGTGAAKPGTAAAKPATAAGKPATAAGKPATAAGKPATAAAKPAKTAGPKPGTAVAKPLKTAKPSTAVAALPAGTACKAYVRCIKGMALAFEAADFPGGKDAAGAMRSAVDAIGSMGDGLAAEEACRTGLDAIADAASAYAMLPGFKYPTECSAPAAVAVAPAPGALLLRARRARIMPATPDGRYWDGRGVPSVAILDAIRALWAGTKDYYAAFVDADPVPLARADRPDPYVIVWLNGRWIGRSSPLADSLLPAWRDGPEVVVANPATDILKFSVHDDDSTAPAPGSEPFGELIGDCTGTVPPEAADDGVWVIRCAEGVFELEVNVREAR